MLRDRQIQGDRVIWWWREIERGSDREKEDDRKIVGDRNRGRQRQRERNWQIKGDRESHLVQYKCILNKNFHE